MKSWNELKTSVRSWFPMHFHSPLRKCKKAASEENITSVMDRLTTQRIDAAVGPLGSITEDFQKRINLYDRSQNPISKAEAESMLLGLLKVAVSQRKMLTGSIQKSIENGGIFDQYYGRIYTLGNLASDAYEKQQLLKKAEERYEHENTLYLMVRDQSIKDSVKGTYDPAMNRQEPNVSSAEPADSLDGENVDLL